MSMRWFRLRTVILRTVCRNQAYTICLECSAALVWLERHMASREHGNGMFGQNTIDLHNTKHAKAEPEAGYL